MEGYFYTPLGYMPDAFIAVLLTSSFVFATTLVCFLYSEVQSTPAFLKRLERVGGLWEVYPSLAVACLGISIACFVLPALNMVAIPGNPWVFLVNATQIVMIGFWLGALVSTFFVMFFSTPLPPNPKPPKRRRPPATTLVFCLYLISASLAGVWLILYTSSNSSPSI